MFTFSFLLCGYFSVVLCTEYLTVWKGMQIPKPLPTPCISLVAGVDVVAHVVEDEVAEVGEEVCNYFRLEYTTPPVLVVEQSPTLLLYSSKLGRSIVGSTSTVIT